jgi:hypothetical protein
VNMRHSYPWRYMPTCMHCNYLIWKISESKDCIPSLKDRWFLVRGQILVNVSKRRIVPCRKQFSNWQNKIHIAQIVVGFIFCGRFEIYWLWTPVIKNEKAFNFELQIRRFQYRSMLQAWATSPLVLQLLHRCLLFPCI